MAQRKSTSRGSTEIPKSASDATSTTNRAQRPPQGQGVPQRPYLLGAQPGYQRLNVAMQVLGDPVARTSFSRVYSGQPGDWRR